MSIRWVRFWAVVFCAAAFTLAGCEGDDGNNGNPGADGADGPAGLACWDLNENGIPDFPDEDRNNDGVIDVLDCQTVGATVPVESCAVCHGADAIGDAAAAHALAPIEDVTGVAFAVNGPDLDVTFDLAADGAPALGYDQIQRGYRTDGLVRTDICNAPSRSDPCDPASLTLTENGGGNYTVKVLGGAAEAGTNNRYLFRVGAGSDRETRVYFFGDSPATPVEIAAPAVTAESCTSCHGPEGIDVHGGYYAAADGAEPCLVCHGVDAVPSLGEVAHEYHSGLLEEITYPSYMNNCSVCHEPPALLAAANSMPVNADACFSCHGSTATMFEDITQGLGLVHAGITDGCETCHVAGGPASNVLLVTDVHNGLTTGRGGIIWDGEDTSVTEGAKFDVQITGVADDGTDLTITWQADYDGAGVNPCNATVGPGAPVFFLPGGGGGGNWSVIRNYAQGEDYILGTDADSAGQPVSTPNLDDTNTTCAGNVATTVFPVEATDAMYGRVGLQGKPAVVSIDPADADGLMRVRAKSATYDYVVGVGGPAPARRAIVDTGLCLDCHVGSLYQHGGNRVDNVDLCYVCHNSAANDQYVRVDEFGVDASEAYDGKAGQNFGIKEMVHGVHPSGTAAYGDSDGAQVPLVIYRGRGIYAWAEDESKLANWPGTGEQPVFGSDDGTGNPVLENHNFHKPTYPRGMYDCAACHTAAFVNLLPDATKAMASTVETGNPPFGNQLNDVLEGVQSSSCMTCHKQWSAADVAEYNAISGHGAQNGWTPQSFEEGRETIIEANQ